MEISYTFIIYPQLKEWWWKVEEGDGDIKAFSKPLIIFITFRLNFHVVSCEVWGFFMAAILWSYQKNDPHKFCILNWLRFENFQ